MNCTVCLTDDTAAMLAMRAVPLRIACFLTGTEAPSVCFKPMAVDGPDVAVKRAICILLALKARLASGVWRDAQTVELG